MARGLTVIAVAWAIAGCGFDTSGLGSGPPVGPNATSPEGDGTLDDGSGGTAGGSGDATSGVDETADGPPMESGPGPHPAVIISDGPTFDFGTLVVNSQLEHAFTITNEGDGDATALQLGLAVAGFAVVGYDCGDTLVAGASCTATVSFAPTLFGDHAGELQLSFDDAGVPAAASRSVMGRGVGMTGNLVINGGGEEGGAFDIPPPGWDTDSGINWVTTSNNVTPIEGNRTIFAGTAIAVSNPTVLYQHIGVAPLTQWGDAAGVMFHFSAHHRAWTSSNNPTTVILRFLGSDMSALGANPSSTNSQASWAQFSGDWVAPPGTHFIRVELVCASALASNCDGYFDAVQLWAEWQG